MTYSLHRAGPSENSTRPALHLAMARMSRNPSCVIAIAVALLVAADRIDGAIINAKSAALRDVDSAIGSAREGDTVVVPAGTVSWNSSLFITKGITLQGATDISGSVSNPVVTDQTIIVDDLPRPNRKQGPNKQSASPTQQMGFFFGALLFGGHPNAVAHPNMGGPAGGGRSAILVASLKPSQSFRLTGFTFKYGSATNIADNGGIHVLGTCPAARIDHCHFDQLYVNPFIMTHGQIYGIVDHCIFDERPRAQTFQIFHDGWGGHAHGDGSWADDNYFGSEKFLFIEDNTFRNAKGVRSNGIDSWAGGRYVVRHNYLVDTPFGGHGTESGARSRGVRAIEAYNNICVWDVVEPRGQLRSGTMLEFNNLWMGKEDRLEKSTRLTCYREFRPFAFWGGANGNNRLDLNDAHGLYARGKHTGGNSSGTLVVADAGWTPNQWVGYSVTNTTQTMKGRAGVDFHRSSYVTGNTSDTISFARDESFGGPNLTFNNGDGYEIYKLLVALDQPGRGKGDLLADKNPATSGSWPHQALEPAYAWGNVYKGGNETHQLNLASQYPTIRENRDYYNQKAPFDATAGVGVGTLADRPKTCTPGVGYWATDQGEWDSTHKGPDGQLYLCTAPNAWSLYYKPYPYPHPLVTGSGPTRSSDKPVN